MFAKKVYQWNAVDVVCNNGELQRGLVVDKQESHLLVDFDIAGKQPELVPCKKAYLSNDYANRGFVDFVITNDALILRKLSRDQPWKWYGGKVLTIPSPFGDPSFAVVEIRIGDQVIKDCVRSDCVRRTASHGRPVRKNDFVMEECSVLEAFSYDAQSIAPWRRRFPRTHPIGIVDNTFRFLQLRYDNDFDANEMASALSDGIPKKHQMDTVEDSRGVRRRHENITSDEDAETSGVTDDLSISHLPLDILGVVFSFLDGRQQTRMRPVCPAWNSKILSPECSREMIVDFRFRQEKNHPYIMGAWFFNCITKWTRYVIITVSGTAPRVLWHGTGPVSIWDGGAMLVLKAIMEYKSPLSALILCNILLEPKNILIESRTAIAENMQTVCSRLIFRDVTVLGLFSPHQEHLISHLARMDSSVEDARIAYGIVNVDSQEALLDCFEGAATNFADPQHHDTLDGVSQAIIQTTGVQGYLTDIYRQSQIINILKEWQKNDVRFGPNTEWKHVQLAQLGANPLTLHNTTLSVLACLVKEWIREDSENDELDDEEEGDYDDEVADYYNLDSDVELAGAYDGL